MKIYLLALLGLAAGGVVKTSSTSSTSDSTAPLAASSDTSHTTVSPPGSTISIPTSSPSSIGSTSSPTAPAGDDIRYIAVSMTFAVDAIDDGGDEEMFSNIKKSVAESLEGALGTDVTMNKFAVVGTAPPGRRLADKVLQVKYEVGVKDTFEAATKHTMTNQEFKDVFTATLESMGTKVKADSKVSTLLRCGDVPETDNGTFTCTDDTPDSNVVCTLACGVNFKTAGNTAYKCGADSKWAGAGGTCVPRVCAAPSTLDVTKGKIDCENKLNAGSGACPLKCDPNFYSEADSAYECVGDDAVDSTKTKGKWQGTMGTCTQIACATNTAVATNGTLDCSGTSLNAGGSACTLGCTTPALYQVDEASGWKCYPNGDVAAGKWAGLKGKCVSRCSTKDSVCRDVGEKIGTCKDEDSNVGTPLTCEKGTAENNVCSGESEDSDCTVPATVGGDKSMKGTCKSSFCTYGEGDVVVKMIMKVPMADDDIEAIIASDGTFKARFKNSIAAVLGVTTSVVKNIELANVGVRRLHDKFLQDAPTRMLQVEYSVQVNQSAAADAKAALEDAQSTFMYSSNLT